MPDLRAACAARHTPMWRMHRDASTVGRVPGCCAVCLPLVPVGSRFQIQTAPCLGTDFCTAIARITLGGTSTGRSRRSDSHAPVAPAIAGAGLQPGTYIGLRARCIQSSPRRAAAHGRYATAKNLGPQRPAASGTKRLRRRSPANPPDSPAPHPVTR